MRFAEYSKETKKLADSLLKGEIPLSTSHKKMIEIVSPSSNVLEIGCANGFMSAKLKEKGCMVTGVELDHEFAEKAKKSCDKVIIGDIEDEKILGLLKGEFQHLIFGDILEHLKDPMYVVFKLKSLLSNDGSIIVSLPNIGIWWMRRDMLRGQFVYTNTGLLDRTHLRFFCYCTAKQFFQDLDLKIQDIHITSN
ncbi:class I SAM-dependent methyltransferase, partial [bacterium]|nr:class I SAM-dependent methyltransferase [bacterium]